MRRSEICRRSKSGFIDLSGGIRELRQSRSLISKTPRQTLRRRTRTGKINTVGFIKIFSCQYSRFQTERRHGGYTVWFGWVDPSRDVFLVCGPGNLYRCAAVTESNLVSFAEFDGNCSAWRAIARIDSPTLRPTQKGKSAINAFGRLLGYAALQQVHFQIRHKGSFLRTTPHLFSHGRGNLELASALRRRGPTC